MWALGKHRNYKKEFKAGLIDNLENPRKTEIGLLLTDGAKSITSIFDFYLHI